MIISILAPEIVVTIYMIIITIVKLPNIFSQILVHRWDRIFQNQEKRNFSCLNSQMIPGIQIKIKPTAMKALHTTYRSSIEEKNEK
jgi:hypothetical protein